jgi:hypothetical protein
MVVGFPLSRQAVQPEQTTQPPAASRACFHLAPHGLQPQPRVNTDRWYYRVFQSAPDLIRELLPGTATSPNRLGLDAGAPADRLYRF